MKTAVISFLAMLLAGPLASARAQEPRNLVPSVTVVGSGKVAAKPDMAEIQVGVVTQANSAAKALKDNNQAMAQLLKVLSARGIADKDQQTSNFNITPQYRRGNQGEQGPEIVGYQVANQVQIKVRKLDSLGELLDDVVASGANQIHGISFSVAEPSHLLDQARNKAMADARHKAELYANAADANLGQVLLIEEQTPHLPRQEMLGMAMGRAAAAAPIAAGEQEFGASVTVTYRIKVRE
jgi:uncharacterized protein YggE